MRTLLFGVSLGSMLILSGCTPAPEPPQPTPSPEQIKAMRDATIVSIRNNPKLSNEEKQNRIKQVMNAK